MPAKKRDEPRYKSFLGRAFTLRQHQTIPSFDTNNERIELEPGDFGEVVLVLDETNTRVKICLANGSFAWIPKFYLHKEIKNGQFQDVDTISECIQELLSLAEDIKEQSHINSKRGHSDKTFFVYAIELERVANLLRQYADTVDPTVKNNKNNDESNKRQKS